MQRLRLCLGREWRGYLGSQISRMSTGQARLDRLFNEARQTTALGAGQARVPDHGEDAYGTRRCARVLRWMHDNQKLPHHLGAADGRFIRSAR